MAVRKIIQIDEEKCNGCGLCIPNCAEGALQIVNGKVKLVKDIYCDGLGACLGHCPQDALTIIEREADEFDMEAVNEMMKEENGNKDGSHENAQGGCPGSAVKQFTGHIAPSGGCPGSRMRQFNQNKTEETKEKVEVSSKLRQWPVQLALVPPNAPYFKQADLLITADCVPFAYGNYHNDFLKDKAVVVGCPKLDDVESYTKKLEQIIKNNDLESITVLRMEVPCCSGIAFAAKTARDNSGINIPIKVVTIGIEGGILKREYV